MSTALHKMFTELAATTKRTEKMRILAANKKTPFVEDVLRYALDPYLRFNVRSLPRPRAPDLFAKQATGEWREAFRLLEQLCTRDLSGNAAKEAVALLRSAMQPSTLNVFDRVLLKNLDCGVSTKTVNAVWPGLVREFETQAAQPFDEKRITFPCVVEPKLNGMRVFVVVEIGEPITYLTRGGRELTSLFHLNEQVVRLLNGGTGVLDCEATSGGTLEEGVGAVKRGAAQEGRDAVLHVFDLLTPGEWRAQKCALPYSRRVRRLDTLQFDDAGVANLRRVSQWRCEDIVTVYELFDEERARGGEGVIVKTMDGMYEFKRTYAWMKVKGEHTADVVIEDTIEGTGKLKGMLGAVRFKFEGRLCRVGTGFSEELRRSLWKQRRKLPGQLMEVEFTDKTAKGSTQHARFIRMRSHKGERT